MLHCASSLYTRELKVILLYQPFQNRTIPQKSSTPLPPLSKGGGLTARHKLLLCCVCLRHTLLFYSPNFSAVKTEGLLPIPTINEIFRIIPLAFRRARVCVCLYGFASVQNFGHTRLRHPCLACPSRCIEPLYFHNLLKSTTTPRHSPPQFKITATGGATFSLVYF